jgi:hypothetical protein
MLCTRSGHARLNPTTQTPPGRGPHHPPTHTPPPHHPNPTATQITDCFYSAGYAVLFATLLGFSLSSIRAPAGLHLLNLVPLAAAAVDTAENALMLALLAAPSAGVAGVVVHLSALKWRLLFATGSVVLGAGMFAIHKSLKGGKRPRGAAAAAGRADAAGGGEGARSTVRKSVRRA